MLVFWGDLSEECLATSSISSATSVQTVVQEKTLG